MIKFARYTFSPVVGAVAIDARLPDLATQVSFQGEGSEHSEKGLVVSRSAAKGEIEVVDVKGKTMRISAGGWNALH